MTCLRISAMAISMGIIASCLTPASERPAKDRAVGSAAGHGATIAVDVPDAGFGGAARAVERGTGMTYQAVRTNGDFEGRTVEQAGRLLHRERVEIRERLGRLRTGGQQECRDDGRLQSHGSSPGARKAPSVRTCCPASKKKRA